MMKQLMAYGIALLAYCIITTMSFDPESDRYTRSVADRVSEMIKSEAKKVTNYHKITETFEEMNRTGQLNDVRRDPEVMMEKLNQRIESFFEGKLKALNELKKKAESAHDEHAHNHSIARREYLNMRNIEDGSDSLKIYPPLSTTLPMNITNSFVQVPLNIYEYKNDILNAVEWTEHLDTVFLSNLNKTNGTILSSYYGDQSGVWRLFPGTKMSENDDNKFFDCRRRVWYVQASASPKDIVIIIDISGSMTGSNIGIATITVRSLISTLAENDYFNVILVNNEVRYLEPCAKFLIQATTENKEQFSLALDSIGAPSGITDADIGIEEAFKILDSDNTYDRVSANCNKAIMLITDGIEGDYIGQRIFEQYNPNKTVRAYAFLVGAEKPGIPKKGLVKMACENRGYFYRIETFGTVWNIVNDYLEVMSRPLSHVQENMEAHYSPPYLDCCGLGMVITISLAVFGRGHDEAGLIGVTGTDIPLSRINELITHEELGAFGHCVIIDNNGFIIFHRKKRTQSTNLLTRRNVFFEDLEYSVNPQDVLELKKHMINRDKQNLTDFPFYWLYDDDTRVTEVTAKASWYPISNTYFALATMVSDSELDVFSVTDDKVVNRWLQAGIAALGTPRATQNHTMKTFSFIEKWEYCRMSAKVNKFKGTKMFYRAEELKELLKSVRSVEDIPSECKTSLLKTMLVTAAIVINRTEETWLPVVTESGLYDALFVETFSGFSRYLATDKQFVVNDYHEFYMSTTFENAAANPRANFIFSFPLKHEDHVDLSSASITLSAAVRVGEKRILAAVSGMKVNSDLVHKMFNETMNATTNNLCQDINNNACMLIDGNAYVVSSNQGNDYVGRFIGDFSGLLVKYLNASGIVKYVLLNDTQRECHSFAEKKKSSGHALTTPLIMMAQWLTSVFQSFNWICIHCFLTFFTRSSNSATSSSAATKWVSCTEQVPFFIIQEMSSARGEIICEPNCNMTYYMYPVKETNLYFLMIQLQNGCRVQCTKLPHKLRRVPVKENGVCNRQQRYRRGPSHCYNQSVPGEDQHCGRGHSLTPSLFCVTLTLLIILLS